PSISMGSSYGPVFEEQPSSVLFPEGSAEEKVTLSCRARANPSASYRWKMNGTDLRLDSDPRYSLMAGNLVINTPVRARDSGSYQCLATNPSGTVISREALLRFGYLHEFSPDERSPLTVTEGVGFTIPCNPPQHYPGLSYRWLQKEFPEFVPAGNGRWFVSQVTGNLYVARADLPDVGNYSCFATSRIDFITKSVFSKATLLRVNSDGLSYRWLQKEFPEFVPAGNGRWFVSQVTGNLYVARADLPDVGNYSCFATSRIDFITKSVFSKATLLRVNSDGQNTFPYRNTHPSSLT
ncbi:Contactin-2, partial [Acipenser ruthenus]